MLSHSQGLTCSDWLSAETPANGFTSRRWQHSALQLHPHGLNPHCSGHQDRQGWGRFGISFSLLSFFLLISETFQIYKVLGWCISSHWLVKLHNRLINWLSWPFTHHRFKPTGHDKSGTCKPSWLYYKIQDGSSNINNKLWCYEVILPWLLPFNWSSTFVLRSEIVLMRISIVSELYFMVWIHMWMLTFVWVYGCVYIWMVVCPHYCVFRGCW